MSQRLTINNLLLLALLGSILLASSGFFCAHRCLKEQRGNSRTAIQTADCHVVFHQPPPARYCPGKACHQGSPPLSNLGRPEFHNRQGQSHPLASSAQPITPDCKVAALQKQYRPPLLSLAMPIDTTLAPLLSLREIRTTVLLN